jgi:predicted membrane protein
MGMHMQGNFDNEHWDEVPDVPDVPARKFGRRSRRQAPAAQRLFFAIALITAGALLFLSNLGLLPEFNLWSIWPLIFVVFGAGKLVSATSSAARAVGVIFISFGTLFTLVTLGILHVRAHNDSWFVSLVLLTIGSVALIKVLESGNPGKPRVGFPQEAVESSNVLKKEVVFGSLKGKVEAADFRGGKLDSVFGSIDLDLRQSQITSVERSATLEVNAVFGSIELRVPETWRVVAHATSVFGSVEDKTLANKSAGFQGPSLFITGAAVFGSVEIKD